MAKKTKKSDVVWKYLLKNKLATPAQVARATGVSYAYAYKLMKNIGTPREVFEAEALIEAKAKIKDIQKEKEQNDFEKSILSAPVRQPVTLKPWTGAIVQILLMLVIVCILSVWLYTAL